MILPFIILSSCKNNQKTSDDIKKTDSISNTEKDSTEMSVRTATLFSFNNEDNTEIIKISGSEASDNDDFWLAGEKNILIVSKYKKDKGNELLIQKDTLLVSDYNHVNIDRKHFLRKKDYFLFATMESPLGNGDLGLYLSFFMLNLKTLKFYILKYEGESTLRSGNFVDGKFIEDKSLDSNVTIKEELYEFANKSKWIYNPSGLDKDINYYRNFEQKWHLDNDPEGSKTLYPAIIKSTYYSEDLFKFNGDYDKDQFIENADYKIVTYFRNNVIGYDKNKKLYFPITVESCDIGCDKKIEFVSENEIEISYEDSTQQADTIDLNKIEFTNNPL
ncbi:hypothetical protein EAH81_01085 [Flavobacterium pectinovorum]|uniref:Uncharacterized protein n=1 Tax=Flavobacterium pectinovorum TaxID=29533 RepID=A0A502F5K4_9FLAO|nr:hypothetical protein EAH81_01085 [Flavobacterium pectinovorum]